MTPRNSFSGSQPLALPLSGDFRLALVWHQGKLALRASSGARTEFVSLDALV